MQTVVYSIIVAFFISLLLGPIIIPILKKLKLGQNVRDDGPESHLKKSGTPTMGGVIIIISFLVGTFLFIKGEWELTLAVILITFFYGTIGFVDDFIKVAMKRSLGLRAYQKLVGQIGIAIIFSIYAYANPEIGSKILIPFTDTYWDLGIFFIPFTTFVIVGTVNSVNLTDGLDGLATTVTLIISASFALVFNAVAEKAFETGNMLLATDMKNVAVAAGALTGACLGFLRFNTYPAKVFMGDTGSLALGGAIASMAVVLKAPLFLLIFGGIYVIEAVSVILQVIYFKLTGNRIFKMSPLHHHYELCGMPESRIVTFFGVATVILCLIGLLAINI
ncbi:MAG: phospho-N-acetylmuramoyl-pentapeptide-transferase [Clostridia bacterium]|nr:phospho-N-acetylmuramoyl-pentapeptide-transferase [Clostridia bacterium]